MGRHDRYLEVRIVYVMPEDEPELTWDVRVRTQVNDKFRLIELGETNMLEPLEEVPASPYVSLALERWLLAQGCQLRLPF